MDIKDRIRQKRAEAGMSLQQIGNKLGVSKTSVNRWEKGVSYPTIDNLKKLEDILALGVLTKDFIETTN